MDSLTVRCFLLWHFERVRLMVSKWISAMGCGKWSAPGSASRSASQSLSKSRRQLVVKLLTSCAIKLTASSASFSECVEIPPVLLRLVRLCSLSVARNDSCSSLSKLVKLTLLFWDNHNSIKSIKKLALLPFVRVLRAVGEIFNRRP